MRLICMNFVALFQFPAEVVLIMIEIKLQMIFSIMKRI